MEMLWLTICTTLCSSELQFLWWFHYALGWYFTWRKDRFAFFFYSGFMNTSMYIEDILLNYVIFYMLFVGADSFMQDNVRLYLAWCMLKFLKEVEVAGFKWAACSPDMNPIERVWDRLGRCILAPTLPPSGKFPRWVENCFARIMGSDSTKRDPCVNWEHAEPVASHYAWSREGDVLYYYQFLVSSVNHLKSLDQFGAYTKLVISYI